HGPVLFGGPAARRHPAMGAYALPLALPHPADPALCGAGLHFDPRLSRAVQPEFRRDQPDPRDRVRHPPPMVHRCGLCPRHDPHRQCLARLSLYDAARHGIPSSRPRRTEEGRHSRRGQRDKGVLHHHPAADSAALPAAAARHLRLQFQQHRPHPAADHRRPGHPAHHHSRRPHRHIGLVHLPHGVYGFRPAIRSRRRDHADHLPRRDRHCLRQFHRHAPHAEGRAMIVEDRRTLWLKKLAAHGFLVAFIALIMFPFLMVVSISFREGNFSVGTLIPSNPTLEHWYLALGLEFTRPDGTVVRPPYPVLLWMWNSVKLGLISAAGALAIATISAYALSRIRFRGRLAFLDS